MANGYTIQSLREDFKKGKTTPAEVFEHYHKKIAKQNKELNAFLSVFETQKLETQKLETSLAGIPAAIKDNMLIEGTVCTGGSKILKHYISAYDATVIAKLKSAGSVFLGKTNMDEFAMGSSTENSAFGPTRNPLDTSRVPGGSSGGSAAAVAADLCVFALGSDTGGSIRQPAALCGVVGLKPTYGRVSRHGLIALASSLDQIGSFTKNVHDAGEVLNVIAGHDKFDSTTVNRVVPDFTVGLEEGIKGLRVGIPKEYFGEGLSQEVRERVEHALKIFEKEGATLVPMSLPHSKYALAVYYIVLPCEVSANLARLDGIRYGHSSKEAGNLLEVYMKSRAEGFGAEPTRRIILGTYALSSGYYDAYYVKAQKVRALIKQDFDKAFQDVDVIVGPTTPTTAFKIGEKSDDPLAMYLSDIYTVPINLAGLPGISIPCGNGAESNLPVGFQIIGNSFDEATVLKVARAVERNI